MKWEDLSVDTLEWFRFLGGFSPTTNVPQRMLRGYVDGDKVYLDSTDLRGLANACVEVADWLENRAKGHQNG